MLLLVWFGSTITTSTKDQTWVVIIEFVLLFNEKSATLWISQSVDLDLLDNHTKILIGFLPNHMAFPIVSDCGNVTRFYECIILRGHPYKTDVETNLGSCRATHRPPLPSLRKHQRFEALQLTMAWLVVLFEQV